MSKKHPSRGLGVFAIIMLLVLLAAAACLAILVLQPSFAEGILESVGLVESSDRDDVSSAVFSDVADTLPNSEQSALMESEALEASRTPYLAESGGILLRSPITMAELTGVLFHQASNEYALEITTQIPEADYDTVADNRNMRINHEQVNTEGAWADTEALHLWRTSDDTEMDTSIDVGAPAGTTVLAPVDGTIVLIRDYRLYDEIDDIEIHIQPDGRPDLDVVLIHTYDPLVKAGDHIQAGITPISHVRDIEADLTDVQLGFFTPEGVGGNHTHIQVNDTNFEDYREKRLEGAIKVR